MIVRFMAVAAGALAGIASIVPLRFAGAQTAEQLAFIPAGGRTILTDIANGKPSADELRVLLTGQHSRDEWVDYLNAHVSAFPALRPLGEKQRLTLADYLSFHMPMPAANPASSGWTRGLPKDGRDLALDYCQGCHIITVVVTQQRSKTTWLGTMGTPSHAVIKLSPAQREELASYLEIDGAIPIDLVPEELRAAGATY